jgi:hypothetical protein
MSKKKDICSLADGKNILEIAYYGPGDHSYLEEEMGSYWFTREILVPFLGEYSKDKTIVVIDYKDGGATRQHFGLGNSPEEAVKSALTTLIAKYEPIVASAEKALRVL